MTKITISHDPTIQKAAVFWGYKSSKIFSNELAVALREIKQEAK